MSAAAALAKPKQRSRRIPLPAELAEQVALPKKYYASVPNSFFSALRLKFWTAFEKDIALLLLERSYGGYEDKTAPGGWNHPRWVDLPAKEIARELGNVSDDGAEKVEGIEKCLNALEDRGLIESKIIGRIKYCRLREENFESAPDRQTRTIERKPPESAEEAHVREAVPAEPLILFAGEKSRPFVLGDYRGKFTSGFAFPIRVLPSIDDEGDLDIQIQPEEQKDTVSDRRTPVRLSARAHEKNGHGAIGGTSDGAAELEKAVRDQRLRAEAELERAEVSVMVDFLTRWYGRQLGKPTYEQAKDALDALQGAGQEDFARRLKKRGAELEYITWEIIIRIAGDVGREHLKRQARLGRPEEPALTPAQRQSLDRFVMANEGRHRK